MNLALWTIQSYVQVKNKDWIACDIFEYQYAKGCVISIKVDMQALAKCTRTSPPC